MGKARLDPLKAVNFRCSCGHRFQAEPVETFPSPGDEHHPFRYEGECPKCHQRAPQVPWERALMKAHAEATGPRTAEGKAVVTKNLEGHPTPEETLRTRFNSLKHGAHARTAQYFPAKPGRYAACEGCEFRDNECERLERENGPCLKRTEIFMLHQIAFERRDPRVLQRLNHELQAQVRVVLDEIVRKLVQQGVTLESPAWYYDRDGGFHLAKYLDPQTGKERSILEVKEHPLLSVMIAMMQKNNLTLADMGMTQKVADEEELLSGFTRPGTETLEEVTVIRRRQTVALEQLPGLIRRSQERLRADPVLLEHQRDADD